MKIHSATEAKERFETLPQEIKNLLYSPQMSLVMQQIGQKNKLHIDQIDYLNNITGQVMLGFLDTKDFSAELVDNLSVERVQADAIAQDVNDLLFNKIREQMQKVYEANKTEAKVVGAGETPIKINTPPPTPLGRRPATGEAQPLATVLPKEPARVTPPAEGIGNREQVVVSNPTSVTSVQPTTSPLPPTPSPDMHQADKILSEPTVTKPPIAPADPKNYATDPYREPPV